MKNAKCKINVNLNYILFFILIYISNVATQKNILYIFIFFKINFCFRFLLKISIYLALPHKKIYYIFFYFF